MGNETRRMPAVFLGHGTPMNALEDNRWTKTWERVGHEIGRPRAILAISAHWCTHGIGVTAMESPPTIHDFGGFSQALFNLEYPAPGDPALAERVRALLAPLPVVLDRESWGLDHGSWSVLSKAYPAADIPVVQLSIDLTQPPRFHFEIGRRIAGLREEGVLLLGSGNIVHNLHVLCRHEDDFAYDWAQRFNDFIRNKLLAHELDAIIDYAAMGQDAALSVPTPEHYYPLLYIAGAAQSDRAVIECDGVCQASISMLSVSFGARAAAAGRSIGDA
jgi:4,5-DOPA dioxygenase extradiol